VVASAAGSICRPARPDVEISRERLEDLIKEDIERSIGLCRKLLLESNYRPDDVDRVVLIGTKSDAYCAPPGFRGTGNSH
jgi:molecular chaperone DnaK (HSP70)